MRKRKRFPWKQNIRNIPAAIADKIARLRPASIMVAATKQIDAATIEAGVYSHLGIRLARGEPEFATPVVPPADVGRFSRRNVEGWEEKRTDLPMVTKSFPVESPNWGDSYYGTHTVWFDREVYQREYHEPRDIAINIEVLQRAVAGGRAFVLKFAVDFVLDPADERFEGDLLFCLNLLQENVGVVDVYRSDVSREDFLRTIRLDWEVFPPGTVDAVVERFRGRIPRLTREAEKVLRDRVDEFAKLKPQQYVLGTGGLNRYVGAKFADDLVVFENVRYGNALYILYEDWEAVSQRSRVDLIRGTDARFDRIVHGPVWKEQFEKIMRRELRKRNQRK